MKTLEETLGHVESLRRELDAEIVLQEEKSHDEKWVRYTSKVETSREDARNLYNTGSGDIVSYKQEMIWVGPLEKEPAKRPNGLREEFNRKIIDQAGIKKPNTEKRADARAELLQVYEACEWYSARYLAGICLNSKELDSKVDNWISEMDLGINANIIRQNTEGGYYEDRWGDLHFAGGGPFAKPYSKEDILNRREKVKDAGKLFRFSENTKVKKLLRETYSKNEIPEVRTEAGKALGYSFLRIWFHETFSSCPRTLEVPAVSSPYPENPDKNEDDNLDPTSFMRGR